MSEKISKMILIPFERYQTLISSSVSEDNLQQNTKKVTDQQFSDKTTCEMHGGGESDHEDEDEEDYSEQENEEEESKGNLASEFNVSDNISRPPPGFPSNEKYHTVEKGDVSRKSNPWINNWISLSQNGKK